MVTKYNDKESLKDNRIFAFGDIWKVRDELIRLLPTDRIDVDRNIHPSRTVIIIQNCLYNNDEESLLIRIAPLAHQVKYQDVFDILLYPDEDGNIHDGVDKICMVQLQLSQPILKKDLYEKVGEISTEKKEEIAAIGLSLLGIEFRDEIVPDSDIECATKEVLE